MVLESKNHCKYCNKLFLPRKSGGSKQTFCSKTCRHEIDTISRKYVRLLLKKKMIDIKTLKLKIQTIEENI